MRGHNELYNPTGLGNRRMGDRPITHVVMYGQPVPEWHDWSHVDTTKGTFRDTPAKTTPTQWEHLWALFK